MNKLSLRLSTVADLIPDGALVCDVGTDHAFLPIFLKTTGKARGVIATDINQKPLKKAKENIEKSGTFGIKLILCDGVEKVKKEEVDTLVIAGMGGEVISGILENGAHITKTENVTIILQPTTSPELLRRYLTENGFSVKKEIPVLENGKLYSVMLCFFTGEKRTLEPWSYFAGLVDVKDKNGRLYIEKQKKRCLKCVKALKNIPEKNKEYLYFKNALEGLEKLLEQAYGI